MFARLQELSRIVSHAGWALPGTCCACAQDAPRSFQGLEKVMVAIITVAIRQNDGTFDKSIDSVWSTKKCAKQALDKIKSTYDNGKHDFIRARNPIGQPDDLSIEVLEGNHYNCKYFYSITEKEVRTFSEN